MRILRPIGLALLIILPAQADDTSPLIQRALTELQMTREIAAAVTNEEEKIVWQKRIELSEKELENVKRRVTLEERDRQLIQAQTRLGARHNLREALRTVESDTKATEANAYELDRKIRGMQADRADLARNLSNKGGTDQEIQQQAEDEQRLQNLDTEIRARILDRDATDQRIRLAREAARIDQSLRARELNPRPTIRQILEIRRQAEIARKATGDVATLIGITESQRTAVAETQALSQERFDHLDEEIKTLESLYSTGRRGLFAKSDPELAQRQQQVLQMLADSRGQRRFLQQRIEHQKAQLAALDDALNALGKSAELSSREHLFLEQEKTDIGRRFLQRISLPGAIIGILIVLHFLMRRLVLPLVLKSESLFVARRAVTYVLALLGIAMLTLFFLEDLKSIATILGLAGAATVIALQDLCSSFAGWFVIIASRKIQVGDRIEVDGHRGDVVDIQLLRTTLYEVGNWMDTDESTGRIVIIPNSFIFKNHVFNYSHVHPYIWGKVRITMTFESPTKHARDMLQRILTEETRQEFEDARRRAPVLAERYGTPDAVYEPRITEHVGSDGVIFNLYYVCHYKKDDETRAKLTRRILQEMEKNPQMRFAYFTQREMELPGLVGYDKGFHK